MGPSYPSELSGERSVMLLIFVLLSFSLHVLLLISFRSSLIDQDIEYIELDLNQAYDEEEFQVPVVPQQNPVKAALSEAIPTQPQKVEQPKIFPSESNLSMSKIRLPNITNIEQTKITTYTPARQTRPRSERSGQEIRQKYLRSIKAKIDRNKTYPDAAKKDRSQGKIKVSFTLLKNGAVENVSSAMNADLHLEKAAINAVIKASPFAPFPDSMQASSINLTIILHFKLSKQ